jgi:diguanylate cyclase (GGDEF)-like protein
MNEVGARAREDAIAAAQLETVARNMPGVYLTVAGAVCFFALFLRDLASPAFFGPWAGLLLYAAFIRGRHWSKLRGRAAAMPIADIQRELDRGAYIAAAICIGFCIIAVVVARATNPVLQAMTMMLVWSAAVGAAFNLAALPGIAASVIAIATLSATGVFLYSGDDTLVMSVPALVGLAAATTVLLRKSFQSFEALALSHIEIASVRQEAVDQASTDALTGLPNRRVFDARLGEWGESERSFAVAIINLDGFKPVNDLHGHIIGDLFLAEAGERLSAAARGAGFLARVGGDEFALLIEDAESGAAAVAVAERLAAAFADPFVYGAISVLLSCTCGVAARCAGEDSGRLLERAGIALHEAKAKARGGVVLFCEELERVALRRTLVEQSLPAAIESGGFHVDFQPIVDLDTGALTGFEALARWRHPELGLVPPMVFIPLAEEKGLIAPLTDRLLRVAARAAARWPSHLRLSFNLSAAQMDQAGTSLAILSAIAECGLPPSRLEIELTETAVLRDIGTATRTIESLAAAGISIALDDFGAGYSSFGQLCDLSMDKVKLDKSFVDRIVADPRAASVVGAIIGMCEIGRAHV